MQILELQPIDEPGGGHREIAVFDLQLTPECRLYGLRLLRMRDGRLLSSDEVKALIVSNDTQGGYLAPEQFERELLRNVVNFSPMRQVARVATASAGAILLPKRTSGMTAQWVGETGRRPETSVTFG